MSSSFDPDQARHFVGPDLGPNCLQSLLADNTSSHLSLHSTVSTQEDPSRIKRKIADWDIKNQIKQKH